MARVTKADVGKTGTITSGNSRIVGQIEGVSELWRSLIIAPEVGTTRISLTVDDWDWTPDPDPLPTTFGSVISLKGAHFILTWGGWVGRTGVPHPVSEMQKQAERYPESVEVVYESE